jgi:hypothetical protein
MAMTVATGLAIAETVNFDDLKSGAAPAGWTATQTGSGTAKWAIEKDESAPSKPNVLKQSGQATFPVCFKNDTNIKDGFVEVKFKPVAGKEDQAGGVIRRVQDAKQLLYIARKRAGGQRHDLSYDQRQARPVQKYQYKGGFRRLAHAPGGLRGQQIQRHI